jgi:hypothetical protein
LNPQTGLETTAFTLSNGSSTHHIYAPAPGLQSAQYVFQQAFGPLTPAGSAGDAGLLQDCIWEALCRGVALDGIFRPNPVQPLQPEAGFSTRAWNTWQNWYQAGRPCHYYAKFLHCSDSDGRDYRQSGDEPLFYGGAAYGFSMDENPVGPYEGPNVPSKTIANIVAGTVRVTVGKW